MDFWPGCGHARLTLDERGWLHPGDDWLRLFLARPELAPVDESCAAERALHAALLEQPTRKVTGERLARLQDADARENYAVFLRFRDALLAAGSLQAFYLELFRRGVGHTPPLFIDLLVQAMLRGLLDALPRDAAGAFEARAAELLFRPQRVAVQDGRVLAADRDAVDLLRETSGLGELGRLLRQAQLQPRALDVEVLTEDNAARYWTGAEAGRHHILLDLTHQLTQDLGHGLQFHLRNARSGLPALARVLERWVAHLLGVQVHIEPVQRIDDERWRWHVGLDAESTALLNDLYEDRPVDDERRQRLLSLFRLEFEDAAEMHADLAGRPVYLGLAHSAEGLLRLKPQNLLLNLPLARVS
ncbi:MAG TPA: DUF6352 family protein [Rubrivivax sp.]|nr:DUF6352 family protein [Rubrivivax sp.]